MVDTKIVEELINTECLVHGNVEGLQGLEAEIEKIAQHDQLASIPLLIYRNEFRTRHAQHMKIRRPRLLVGMINYDHYPNFQTFPLLKFGDIVSLARPGTGNQSPDRLEFDVMLEDLSEAIGRMPQGFIPDYYWDVQVCGGGMHPLGLEKLQFPTVAGFCHLYRGVNVAAAGHLYDCLAPVSRSFVPLFKAMFPNKVILDIPFGGNWGSFALFDKPVDQPRDIDFLVSFGETSRIEYGGFRNRALNLAKAFAKKYNDRYNVVFLSGVGKDDYSDFLGRSKVCLNVAAFNGPYNYRTCEIINSGAALLNMDIKFDDIEQSMSDYFIDGKEYFSCTDVNFEQVLLNILAAPANIKEVALAGQKRLRQQYSYQKIQQAIHREVKKVTPAVLNRARAYGDKHFEIWLRAVTTAAPHHQGRRAIFAQLCAGLEDLSSVEAKRWMLIGLPWLEAIHKTLTPSVLANKTLAQYMQASIFHALEYLYFGIPAEQRTVFDKWTYLCYKARYSESDIQALDALLEEIKELQATQRTPTESLTPFPLDFDVPIEEFDNQRKLLVDMPFMQQAGNEVGQINALYDYMRWWLKYFIEKTATETRNAYLIEKANATRYVENIYDVR